MNKNRDNRASSEGLPANVDSKEELKSAETPITPTQASLLEYEFAVALSSSGATPSEEKSSEKVSQNQAVLTSHKISVEYNRSISVEEFRERKITEVSESGNETDLDIMYILFFFYNFYE